MIKYLTDLECIQFERLLLLRSKELSLSDQESHLLLLIYTFSSLRKKMITPTLLLQYSSLTPQEMDHVLESLLHKKWISNKNGAICLNNFIKRLLEKEEEVVEEKMNLVDVFEEEFGRPLTPMELESIKEWVQGGYSEEMIYKALKEAVKSNVSSLRYIEGILINWAQNGIKERYIEEKPKERVVPANASLEELQDQIKVIGLYRNKAKNLKAMAQELVENYQGEVPCTRKELESLPGVGRKTTNVVLSVGFNVPAFAVDTHVERISKRLGFAKKDDTVQDVERKVCRSIERSRWNKAHHQFIFFGRYFCKAQNPNCKECHLYDMCKEKRK